MAADSDLILLPWLRRGGATAVQQADTLTAAQPGVAAALASLAVNGAPAVSVGVRLMGPGHVTGLQPGQVIRTDPTPGSRAFEPNYFPLIEFDEPSLPWLFTPVSANAQQQLRPWLCLAVVRKQPGVRLDPPRRGSLPVLTISQPADPSTELPDLATSWAWAHAQVTGDRPAGGAGAETDESAADITRLLDQRPDLTLSRLVSGRILEPNTDYIACVVPAFELGRLAGLALDIPAAEEARLQPAWTVGDALTSVELPVFYSWDFATGPHGDFQSLALLLKARPLPPGVGERRIDVTESGVGVPVPAETTVPLGGALRPVTAAPMNWPDETVHEAFRVGLAAITNAPDAMPADTALLAPPRYGGTQSLLTTLDPARRDRWYEQLNLEPSARVTAQFGTRVVQDQQEALVAAAWDQAAALDQVNAALRHAQLGRVVGWSLHRRHLSRMRPDTGLQVIAPAQARLSRSAAANLPGTGLVALLQAAQVPQSAYGAAMRRVARPQGAIRRRVERMSGPDPLALTVRPRSILRSLQPSSLILRRFQAPQVDGMVTIERVALSLQSPRTDVTWAEASAEAVAAAPPQAGFQFQPFVGMVMDPRAVPPLPLPGPLQPGPLQPGRPRPGRPLPGGPLSGFPRRGRPLPDDPVALRPIDPDNPDGPFDPDPDPVDPDPVDPDPVDPLPPRPDSADAAAFRAAASAHLQRFDPRVPRTPRVLTAPIDLALVFTEALLRIEPTETFAAQVRVMIARPGAPVTDEQALDAVGFVPRFPQPLALSLAALGQDLLLPGLEGVPPNTVVPLQTNSPFVDAFMVGFNNELGRELVWREFPTPVTATYANRFWDPGVANRPPDIPPLADWADRPLGGSTAADERFVVLLRCELLRRYPHAVVYATKPGAEPATPIFSGAMEPDVRFFGFDIPADEIADWSIVVAEQPTAPRFGVEVDEVPSGVSHVPVTDADAARLATRVRQQPVRVTIPATVLLGAAP